MRRGLDMTQHANNPPSPEPPADPDEVEILEVEGMSGNEPMPFGDEVEIVFEDKPEPEPEPVSAPPPAADVAGRERLLRLQADFDNFKKRIEREQEDFRRMATLRLVTALLPVLDNFERALASAAGGDGALLSGVELIHRQMLEALRKEGLRPVEVLGQPFDPSVHEAVATDAAPGRPPNSVVEEFQRGYFLHERLLRPALVRVSVSADPQEEETVTGEVG
jgi:molecular chaperone GrpE